MIKTNDNIAVRLPNSYQEVKYIESSGEQYINTEIVPYGNYKYETDFMVLSTNSINQWKCIFGARDYPNGDWYTHRFECLYFNYNGNNIALNHNYNTNDSYDSSYIYSIDEKINVVIDKGTTYVNGSLVSEMSPGEATFNTSWHNIPIYLFNNHIYNNDTGTDVIQNRNQKIRIYLFKIWDGNGTLIRYYIPCYRKSDNVIGMYDLVNKTFTAGTGNFTKGSNAEQHTVKKIMTKVNGVMKDIEYIKTKVNGTMEIVFDKLPSTYTRYDYVWTPISSGSSSEPRIWRSYQALIMLKEYANLDLVSYEFDFKSEQVYPTDYNLCLLGGRSVNGETNGVGFYITGQYKTFNMCHGSNHYTNLTYTLGVKSHIKYKNTSVSPSELIVDGSSENLTWSNVVSIPNTKLVLFINYVKNDTGNPIQTVRVKIGTVKVYDLSGNLINNYVPCVRKSDNVIGMYDTVENVFYTTSNTTYATIGNRNCIYEVGNW